MMQYKGVSPKSTSVNLCKPTHNGMNYSNFMCPVESVSCEKEGKKLQKFEYFQNENSFFDEINNIFYSF